jgi:hypothetical protein
MVFGIGSVVFIIALVPMVLSQHNPPLSASIPTAFVSYAFSIAYFTLCLPLAGVTTAAQAVLWTILAAQERRKA